MNRKYALDADAIVHIQKNDVYTFLWHQLLYKEKAIISVDTQESSYTILI